LLLTSERIFAVDVGNMLYFIWVNVVKPDVVQVIAVTLATEYIQASLRLHVNTTHSVTHVSPCHTSYHPPQDSLNSSTTTRRQHSQFTSVITRRKFQFSYSQHNSIGVLHSLIDFYEKKFRKRTKTMFPGVSGSEVHTDRMEDHWLSKLWLRFQLDVT